MAPAVLDWFSPKLKLASDNGEATSLSQPVFSQLSPEADGSGGHHSTLADLLNNDDNLLEWLSGMLRLTQPDAQGDPVSNGLSKEALLDQANVEADSRNFAGAAKTLLNSSLADPEGLDQLTKALPRDRLAEAIVSALKQCLGEEVSPGAHVADNSSIMSLHQALTFLLAISGDGVLSGRDPWGMRSLLHKLDAVPIVCKVLKQCEERKKAGMEAGEDTAIVLQGLAALRALTMPDDPHTAKEVFWMEEHPELGHLTSGTVVREMIELCVSTLRNPKKLPKPKA